jgi:hypothetical protein
MPIVGERCEIKWKISLNSTFQNINLVNYDVIPTIIWVKSTLIVSEVSILTFWIRSDPVTEYISLKIKKNKIVWDLILKNKNQISSQNTQ